MNRQEAVQHAKKRSLEGIRYDAIAQEIFDLGYVPDSQRANKDNPVLVSTICAWLRDDRGGEPAEKAKEARKRANRLKQSKTGREKEKETVCTAEKIYRLLKDLAPTHQKIILNRVHEKLWGSG